MNGPTDPLRRAVPRARSSRPCLAVVVALGAFALTSCRAGPSAESTSGETHFLTLCDPGATCGGGLQCICDVCTLPCDEQNACTSLPGSRCVDVAEASACTTAVTSGICDVRCVLDSDCNGVSGEHACHDGMCRIRSSEPPVQADADATTLPMPDAGPPPMACITGAVRPSEVVVLGDSFFAVDHRITGFLEDLARTSGTLAVGERYRDNSRVVDNSLAFMGEGIAGQYDRAIEESAVRVVVMNGGGADTLLGSCDTVDASCPVFVEAVMAAQRLWTRMSADGVTDVVYVSYPDPQSESTRVMMDALRPLLRDACTAAAPLCHWLDLRPAFEGHYDEYVASDGLNPTTEGSAATAQEIWTVMQQNCIAQ